MNPNILINLEKNNSQNEIFQNIPIKKDYDIFENIEELENSLISKIFKISFEKKENFVELINLRAQYESLDKPLLFRLDYLDEYIIEIINNSEINCKIVENFLLFYNRAYTMLEIKFREKLDKKYDIIRMTICSYLALIISSPENFGLVINNQDLIKGLTDFYLESDKKELDFLFSDLVKCTSTDIECCRKIFSFYIFGIIHEINLRSESNFYHNDKIKNNLIILTNLLNDHEILRKMYTDSKLFRIPQLDGKSYQTSTLLGYYFNLVSFECNNQNLIKNAFSSIEMVK